MSTDREKAWVLAAEGTREDIERALATARAEGAKAERERRAASEPVHCGRWDDGCGSCLCSCEMCDPATAIRARTTEGA